MGFLQQETEDVDLGRGYSARVRTLTSGEYGEIEKVLTQTRMTGQGDVDMKADIGEYRRRLVVEALVEWNLTDENDQLLPLPPIPPAGAKPQVRATQVRVRRNSVDILPQWAFEKIYQVANRINGSRSKAEIAQFPDADERSGEDAEAGAAGAAEVPAGAADVAAAGSASGGVGGDSLQA